MEHPGEASTPFQGCILFGTVNGTIGEFSPFFFLKINSWDQEICLKSDVEFQIVIVGWENVEIERTRTVLHKPYFAQYDKRASRIIFWT